MWQLSLVLFVLVIILTIIISNQNRELDSIMWDKNIEGIKLKEQLNNATLNTETLQYLFNQARFSNPSTKSLLICLDQDNIFVAGLSGTALVSEQEFKRILNDGLTPFGQYVHEIKKNVQNRLLEAKSFERYTRQLEEHSELDSTMRELDKELSLSPP